MCPRRRRHCSLLSSAVYCICEASQAVLCTGVCRRGEGGAGGGVDEVTGYWLMRGFQMSLMYQS